MNPDKESARLQPGASANHLPASYPPCGSCSECQQRARALVRESRRPERITERTSGPDLDALVRHADRFGPECVYEAGESILPHDDLVLRVHVDGLAGRRRGRRGRDEMIEAARLLRAEGKVVSVIADKLGVSDKTVRAYLARPRPSKNGPTNPVSMRAKNPRGPDRDQLPLPGLSTGLEAA